MKRAGIVLLFLFVVGLIGSMMFYGCSMRIDECERVHPDRNLILCVILKGAK
jgi:hypothetical protein